MDDRPAVPQSIIECLRYEGMSDADIKTMIPGSVMPTSPDTWWSSMRWRIALAIVGRAMRIAPAGTARDRWGDAQRAWSKECRDAWAQRYPESNRKVKP